MGCSIEGPGRAGKAMSVLQGGCGILCERQEVLKGLVVSKKDMQRTAPEDCQRKIYEELDEQRGKEASLLVQKKHELIKWEGEREKARTMQRLEVTRTMSPWSGGHDHSSFWLLFLVTGTPTPRRQCPRLPE